MRVVSAGSGGTVIVREQIRPVASEDKMKPKPAADAIEALIPFRFGVQHLARIWRKLNLRPPEGDSRPERTRQEFCVYDRPHRDYLYTQAFVDYVSSKARTREGFVEMTGLEPVAKPESR